MTTSTIDRGWTLHPISGPLPSDLPTSIPAVVPGTVHTDLLAAGLIPDPYLDTNEAELQWIGECDFRYDVNFAFVDEGHERTDLVCSGLDTIATLALNGVVLGAARNQHRSYRFDISNALEAGSNSLSVAFDSAIGFAREAEGRVGSKPFIGNALPYNAVRKMACNFGWDWGPVLVTAGIIGPIAVEQWSTARISSLRPTVSVDADGNGSLALTVDLERTDDTELRLAARITDVKGVEVASSGASVAGAGGGVSLHVLAPELWWPRGYGEQPLYQLQVEVLAGERLVTSATRTLGFRTIVVDQSADEFGTPFSFIVNGRPVFIKGANWIPDDCFITRVTPDRYAHGIKDATEAGMNLLRVWGGGIYESEVFYDLCDREGLLVWQDFLFACAAYSEADELWHEVEAEARENVARIMSHPSLSIWNGGNENVEGFWFWGWKDALAEGEAWGNGYYEKLLPSIVAELDPSRAYLPSSPWNPVDPSNPRDPDHGPVHSWVVWNQKDYTTYRDSIPRFVAEFGFQGPPNASTIARAIHDDPLAPDSVGMRSHQKAGGNNDKLDSGFAPHLPSPSDFDDWHFTTQLNQARAITYGIEHFRSWAPRNGGSIIWQLNDCWPVLSWAAVDGDKRRKPLWYALRNVNADRLLMFQPRAGVPALIVSNDADAEWAESLTIERLALDGTVLASEEVHLHLAPRTTRTFALQTETVGADDPRREVIRVRSAFARAAFWYFVEDVALDMPKHSLTTSVETVSGGYRIDVTAQTFLKDLVFNVDRLDPAATVDEMFLTLMPGETAAIRVTTDRRLDERILTQHPVLNSVNSLVHRSGAAATPEPTRDPADGLASRTN